MNKWLLEAIRLIPVILALIVLVPDDSRSVIMFGVAIVLLAVGVAHLVRKLIFPYIDVKVLVDKAKENPTSSAMVILGLMYLLATIIQSLVALLR